MDYLVKILFLLGGISVAFFAYPWVGNVRIFVVQPIGAIPKGVTVVVYGVEGLRFIDSPDAFCQRKSGGVSLFCRGMTADKVVREGTILLRLPFNRTLYALSNAPVLDQ
ncbi:hypothetical protein [Kaistia algarum]|uniref:hypothetical protein n=1 Tax=Kaistia algarum TaxID=2083279 RepID=UPI0022521E1F|nr:hypothetical protein [Kaistia algarum]MCX5514008.1 hypothetical protein [Kaistia algarum]